MSDEETGESMTPARAKERFLEDRGYWPSRMDELVELDPGFVDRYRELSGHPWREGVLEPKVREFMYIAADASTTHLYEFGTRAHIGNALEKGATVEEVLEVLELASVIGIHSATEGVPILLEEAGRPTDLDRDARDRREELMAEIEEGREYWGANYEDVRAMVEADPAYYEAYRDFANHPWKEGVLDDKVREFVYVAVDVATTHLYAKGTRTHVRNALEAGATREEVLEVIELASVIGIHTMTDGVPILVEEARERGMLPEDADLE